jgi:8-oxo-dGTP pyrophosphatase MutT (NUDIX family)
VNLDQLLERKEQAQRPTVVCLCGSTRFGEAYREANLRETLAGKIVLSIGCDTKSDHDLAAAGTAINKEDLDLLHLHKIDLADEVLVLNVDGYVGDSTYREIQYARRMGKRVRYLEKVCPHKCVGALIRNLDGEILLFQRGTKPAGFAGPAGHCDDGDLPEAALVKEVQEEVGLKVVHYRDPHPCRRTFEGEPGHDWHFYDVRVSGLIQTNDREVVPRSCRYYSPGELCELADKSEQRLAGKISDKAWEQQPGLDLPWYELFRRLELV